MEKWILRYWDDIASKNPIESWLDKLTEEQFRSIAKELKLLESMGYR